MTFRTWATIGICVAGVATMVTGLVLGGGPEYARMFQRDQLRSQGISDITNAVNNFYSMNSRIPTNAEYPEFFSGKPGSMFIFGSNHPFAKDQPVYTASSTADAYSLCTTFETEQNRNSGTSYPSTLGPNGTVTSYNDYWAHLSGRTCFNISIDPYIKDEAARRRADTASSTQP